MNGSLDLPEGARRRPRPRLYDEAVRPALIVLWEASDRICGKRLKALLPVLLPALERNGHLQLAGAIRARLTDRGGFGCLDRISGSLSVELRVVG